jgi:hypothetical protein
MKRQLCSGLVLIFALAACSRPEPLNLRARAIWLKHQRVVEAAVRGERTDVAELKDSVDFFEQTAGISIPGGSFARNRLVSHAQDSSGPGAAAPLVPSERESIILGPRG